MVQNPNRRTQQQELQMGSFKVRGRAIKEAQVIGMEQKTKQPMTTSTISQRNSNTPLG